MNTSLNHWDWTVISIYFVFIIGIGFIFKNINKNSSDFFRGGGNMIWWMSGMSAIAASISTWSFAAAATKVYETGFLLPATWIMGMPLTIIILWFMAPRFRQMRVITSMEAVARRFGFGSEQFFVYLALPMSLIWGGIGACGLGVFFGGALGLPVIPTMIGIISIVTIMSMFGGEWAIAASDFVQGLLMFLTVLIVVYFSVNLPEIGGIMNLHNALPEHHFDVVKNSRIEIVVMWIITMQVVNLLATMNMQGEGSKFLSVKNGKQARAMVAMRAVLFLVIPVTLIMQIPAMCAATVFPNMQEVFPDMKVPTEGAFLAMAFKVMPQGMMGLLVCGMFAAAMSSMDSALNKNSGFFVRNVYVRYINKEASDTRQLFMGRLFTLIFGLTTILIGIAVQGSRDMDMFSIFQLLNSMLWLPVLIPITLGIIYKKTPGWSAWSTVIVGICTAAISKSFYSVDLVQSFLGYDTPLNESEAIDSEYIFLSFMVFIVCFAWFFFTALFYKKTTPEYKESVESLFKDMRTPIDHENEPMRDQDAMQYQLVGMLCLIFGFFALLGILIPNPIHGKLSFLFVGGIVFCLGLFLYSIYLKKKKDMPI